MRPIDADALIEKCGDWYVEEGTESGFIGTLKNLLATMPTIQPEKAQLLRESTTSDLISRTETVERLRITLGATVPISDYDDGFVDGVQFAISTVSTMPTIQPQSTTGQLNNGAQSTVQSTDLIDRQAAIDEIKSVYEWHDTVTMERLIEHLNNLPTAQPERKKGEWIEISSINHTYKCSECGRLLVNVADGRNNVSKHYPYCHCGADMKGGSNE